MSENPSIDRRDQTNELVENMLQQRKQLLALLFQVKDLSMDEISDSDQELFDEFCQVLVDYIAAAHFGLYARIAEGTERRKAVADLAAKIYPRIQESTEVALAFNELYDTNNSNPQDYSDIDNNLSNLAEHITTRIELEDQLINLMR